MQTLGKQMAKLFLIIASTFQFLYAVGVEATVSNTDVVQGESVKFRIIATGDNATFPNINKVGNAQVLGRHKGQNSSHSYVNGKFESKHTTTLSLTFIPQKDMTIPSFSVTIDGSVYKTETIEIKVLKATATKNRGSSKFSLRMKADKNSVVVGEAFVVTVYFSLKNGIRLSDNPQYTKPEFNGFFVKEIPQKDPYRKGSYQVSEIKYILIPTSKGNFTLSGARAKIGLADTSRRDMFGRFFGINWTPIASNSLEIEVKEKLEETDLVGKFTLKSKLDHKKVKANKPVNLTVTIKGEGSLEDFEFPKYEIDGVTIYSDEAKVQSRFIKGKLQSTLVKSFAFISEQDFEIPALSISMYDVKTSKVSYLKIPKYQVKVEAKKVVATVANVSNSKGVIQTNLKPSAQVEESIITEVVEKKNVAWWMLLIAFILGLLLMYIVQYLPIIYKFKREKSPFKESEALKILYAHMSEDTKVEAMVRKLYAKKNGDKSVEIDKKVLRELVEKYKEQ
ncbi:MAG: BatD family protein [Campylobacterota bacterium]|nr:BatD family protein [Campylobacterota bacterium]